MPLTMWNTQNGILKKTTGKSKPVVCVFILMNKCNRDIKIILKIWHAQILRDSRWSDILIKVYLLALLLISLFIVCSIYDEEISGVITGADISLYASRIACMMMVPDFIVKLIMKRDCTVMDDYLKTRPVVDCSWSIFLILINSVNFWTWLPLFFLIPFSVIAMPVCKAMMASLMFFAVSLANSFAVSVMHRAQKWEYKIPVLFAGCVWIPSVAFYSFNTFSLPWGLHVLGFSLLCVLMIYALYRYNSTLHCYASYSVSVRRTHRMKASLTTLNLVGLLRSKRLIFGMLFPYFYIPQLMMLDSEYVTQRMICLNVACLQCASSLLMGVMAFGIEANFMDGLWTRPFTVRKQLCNIYYFYAAANIVYAAIMEMILHDMQQIALYFIPAGLLFAIGAVNTLAFINIFKTRRLDLFTISFFNYQDYSMSLTKLNIVSVMPLLMEILLIYLLPLKVVCAIIGSIGILGILSHRFILDWFAKRYIRNRYEHFERYRN